MDTASGPVLVSRLMPLLLLGGPIRFDRLLLPPAPLALFELLPVLDFLHEGLGKRSNEYRGMVSWGCCPEMSDEVADLFDCNDGRMIQSA